MIRFGKIEQGADPMALLDPEDVNNSPAIGELADQFRTMLPSRFSNIKPAISPTPQLNSGFRADCQNPGCGVRVFIHIKRSINGEWKFIDSLTFDRLQNAKCGECRNRKW